jgi:hypothetical protein
VFNKSFSFDEVISHFFQIPYRFIVVILAASLAYAKYLTDGPCAKSPNYKNCCPVGYYCPTLTSKIKCLPGYYCPIGSARQKWCPVGYYCPTPSILKTCKLTYYCPKGSTRQKKCPAGYYCPTPSIRVKCPKKYNCPAGSTALPRHGKQEDVHETVDAPSVDSASDSAGAAQA